MDFQGRVAIVTGGSGALGSAVALDLAGNGARVAVPYTADEHWAALESRAGAARERLWGAKADLTKAAAVERFVADVTERWGRVDFLVCIAGGFAAGKIHETSEETLGPDVRSEPADGLSCRPCRRAGDDPTKLRPDYYHFQWSDSERRRRGHCRLRDIERRGPPAYGNPRAVN